jgi:hypothetical protein
VAAYIVQVLVRCVCAVHWSGVKCCTLLLAVWYIRSRKFSTTGTKDTLLLTIFVHFTSHNLFQPVFLKCPFSCFSHFWCTLSINSFTYFQKFPRMSYFMYYVWYPIYLKFLDLISINNGRSVYVRASVFVSLFPTLFLLDPNYIIGTFF